MCIAERQNTPAFLAASQVITSNVDENGFDEHGYQDIESDGKVRAVNFILHRLYHVTGGFHHGNVKAISTPPLFSSCMPIMVDLASNDHYLINMIYGKSLVSPEAKYL